MYEKLNVYTILYIIYVLCNHEDLSKTINLSKIQYFKLNF